MTSLESAEMPQKTLSCWPLAFSAGLLGVGQNGLLVAIPVLVIQTNLSLSIWAALLMLGSMLFLPSSRGGESKLPVLAVSLWCCGLWGIRCKLYSAWAGKHADGDRRCNNSGGAGNINHRADRLRAYRVSDGTSLSGLGIAESGGRE